MKLSKIYSNSSSFKNMEFSEGMNLVLGKVKEENINNDTHNLGKTSLVDLIDFLLLKQIRSESIFKTHFNLFESHIFFLEIHLNDNNYLTIKRSVKNPTKISFKFSKEKLTDDPDKIEWDHENLAFEKAKKKLNDYLGFDVLKKYNFRKFLKYFLKNQDSYSSNFSKNEKGKDKEWKTPLLDFFGIGSDKYEEKLKKEEIKEEYINKYSDLETLTKDLNNKEAELSILKRKQEASLQNIGNFNLYKFDQEVSDELVNEISKKIAYKNKARYNLEYDIKRIEESLLNEVNTIDFQVIEKIFNEVNIYFPDNLKKSYAELVKFNKQIFEERKEVLESSLKHRKEDLEKIDNELLILNNNRAEKLKILDENKIYHKFAQEKIELETFNLKIESANKNIEEIREKINKADEIVKLENDINTLKGEFNKKLSEPKTPYSEIREVLMELTESLFDDRVGIFEIELNGNGNPEFKLYYQKVSDGQITAEDKGSTYQELLVACFCISIAIYYSKNSFYKFLFQDGIIDGGDNRKKVKFIRLVKKVSEKYDLQYVTTAIEHEVQASDVKKELKDVNILAELNDSSDEKGTLYGFSF